VRSPRDGAGCEDIERAEIELRTGEGTRELPRRALVEAQLRRMRRDLPALGVRAARHRCDRWDHVQSSNPISTAGQQNRQRNLNLGAICRAISYNLLPV